MERSGGARNEAHWSFIATNTRCSRNCECSQIRCFDYHQIFIQFSKSYIYFFFMDSSFFFIFINRLINGYVLLLLLNLMSLVLQYQTNGPESLRCRWAQSQLVRVSLCMERMSITPVILTVTFMLNAFQVVVHP